MTLTPREREILVLRAHGLTMDAIAYQLGVSVQTAKNQVTTAYRALGVSCLTEAYLALGWLTPPPHDALAGASGTVVPSGSDGTAPGGRVACREAIDSGV